MPPLDLSKYSSEVFSLWCSRHNHWRLESLSAPPCHSGTIWSNSSPNPTNPSLVQVAQSRAFSRVNFLTAAILELPWRRFVPEPTLAMRVSSVRIDGFNVFMLCPLSFELAQLVLSKWRSSTICHVNQWASWASWATSMKNCFLITFDYQSCYS